MTFVASARRLARELEKLADKAEAFPIGPLLRRDPTVSILTHAMQAAEKFAADCAARLDRARKG